MCDDMRGMNGKVGGLNVYHLLSLFPDLINRWADKSAHRRRFFALSVFAIGLGGLMTIKAKCFAIGRCIAAAFVNGGTMVRLPSSAFTFVMVVKDKLLSTAFTFAVGVVEDFSLHFIRKSHCWFSFKRYRRAYHSGALLWSGAAMQLSVEV